MRKLYGAIGLSVALMLVSATLTLAWPGGAPAKVIIGGPGIRGNVEVTESVLLDGLGTEQLVDYNQRVSPAPQLGTGFKLPRYMDGQGSVFIDQLIYYPHPGSGRGVVLYQGSESSGGEAFRGYYYYATPQGNAAMRKLIQKLGGSLNESQVGASGVSVKLDSVPDQIVAGRKVLVGLSVIQPAGTLPDALTIYATESGSASSTVFTAHSDEAPGQYSLQLELPRSGLWYVSVDLGSQGGRQELAALKAVESSVPATTSGSTARAGRNDSGSASWIWLAAVAVLALGAVGAVGFWLGRLGTQRHQ